MPTFLCSWWQMTSQMEKGLLGKRTLFQPFWQGLPQRPPDPEIIKKKNIFSEDFQSGFAYTHVVHCSFCCSSSSNLSAEPCRASYLGACDVADTQVLQIRRFCRYAGLAVMHVLQIRRFWLSRVPAFVPASASAVTADADRKGVRR